MPNPGSESKDEQKIEEQQAPEPSAKDEGKKDQPEEKKYTDTDLNDLLNRKFGELSAKLEKKYADQFKAERDKLTEAQKLEKMNDEEKAKYNADKLQARIDELEREKNLSEQMTVARKTLKEANVGVSDELLSAFVTPDAETTKKAVDAFKEMYTRDLNAGITEALKRTPPKADPQNPKPGKSFGAQYAERTNQERVPHKTE